MIWLTTYEWKLGNTGCKVYQFLSAFTYYSNSNVIMAIGIDRVKVVYTSHVQGKIHATYDVTKCKINLRGDVNSPSAHFAGIRLANGCFLCFAVSFL